MDQKIKKISIGVGVGIVAILVGIAVAFINKSGSPELGQQPGDTQGMAQPSEPTLQELLQSVSVPASVETSATAAKNISSQAVKTITAPTEKTPVSTTVSQNVIDSLSAPAK